MPGSININEINTLEKRYFEFLANLFEKKGTTFTKNLLSQYAIKDTWSDYSGDMAFIQRGLESVIQSVIYENVDWEICSTPMGADSIFQSSRAMIHIDAKAYKSTDGDATGNKVTLGPNQTSCFTIDPLVYDGIPFYSNLPITYPHKVYGQIPCLTYFLKLVYNLDNELESFRKFKLFLYSLPNGLLNDALGNEHFQAGRSIKQGQRTSIRLNFNKLEVDETNPLKWKRFLELDMI